MNISGKCSLIVRGNAFNQESLEQTLGLKATRFEKKGEVTSIVIGENPFDVWNYDIDIQKDECFENTILEILSKIEIASEYLKGISKENEVYLKCYISSEFAQIQFDLSPSTIKKMSESWLKFHFSILSWGNVED